MPPTDDQRNLFPIPNGFNQIPITPIPSFSCNNTLYLSPARKNPHKILCFLLKGILMALIISLFLLFLGIAAVAFVGRSLHLHHFLRRQSTSIIFCYKCSTEGYSEEELWKYLPKLLHTSAAGHDCPICLDYFKDGESTCNLPGCGHMFHLNCIRKWLSKVANCPVCRGTVRAENEMESYEISGLMGILKETFRILPSKNGKLIAGVTLISTIIVSVSLICYIWVTNFLSFDLHAKMKMVLITHKGLSFPHLFPAIKQDVGFILVCLFAIKLESVLDVAFTVTATTLASAAAYSRTSSFSFKELMLKVKGSIMRPIITVFYINLITFGLVLLVLCLLGTLALVIEKKSTVKAIAILFGILVWALLLYWSVVFQLAITISVMEDGEDGVCGIEAIGKAGRLVKGKWMDGFVINLIFETVAIIVLILCAMMISKSMVYRVIAAVLVTIVIRVVRMLLYILYTVLYFQCKKIHGRKIVGLQEISEYTKVPSFEHLP